MTHATTQTPQDGSACEISGDGEKRVEYSNRFTPNRFTPAFESIRTSAILSVDDDITCASISMLTISIRSQRAPGKIGTGSSLGDFHHYFS